MWYGWRWLLRYSKRIGSVCFDSPISEAETSTMTTTTNNRNKRAHLIFTVRFFHARVKWDTVNEIKHSGVHDDVNQKEQVISRLKQETRTKKTKRIFLGASGDFFFVLQLKETDNNGQENWILVYLNNDFASWNPTNLNKLISHQQIIIIYLF